MPEEQKTKLRLEIAHVLFLDIVGYSKLLISEQSEQLQKLKEIVRGTEQVRLAEAEGKLIRLATWFFDITSQRVVHQRDARACGAWEGTKKRVTNWPGRQLEFALSAPPLPRRMAA